MCVAERAVVLDIDDLQWDSGAPMPMLLSSELRTLFAFYRPDHDVQDGLEVQTAEFVRCTAVKFGFPNDEVLHGHRLWGAGLTFYAAHRVDESEWLKELRRIEAVHDRSPTNPFADSQHFLLAFHDSTLEAVATRIEMQARYETLGAAVQAMAAELTRF